MNQQLRGIATVLVTLALLGSGSCSKPSGNSTNTNVDYWTCSMHPSVRSKAPGKCPICSMELVPVMKTDKGQKQPSDQSAEKMGMSPEEHAKMKGKKDGMKGMEGMPGMGEDKEKAKEEQPSEF